MKKAEKAFLENEINPVSFVHKFWKHLVLISGGLVRYCSFSIC